MRWWAFSRKRSRKRARLYIFDDLVAGGDDEPGAALIELAQFAIGFGAGAFEQSKGMNHLRRKRSAGDWEIEHRALRGCAKEH